MSLVIIGDVFFDKSYLEILIMYFFRSVFDNSCDDSGLVDLILKIICILDYLVIDFFSNDWFFSVILFNNYF